MKLTVPQRTIANDPARFRVAICGRRFGKTYLSIRELCYQARLTDQEVWYVAPSYKQAKNIVWRPLKRRLLDLRWVYKINETELSIELKNGSMIKLKGADNYDSLRGVGLNFLVLDEFADIDPEAWFETLRPTLSDRGGRGLFIGTPKGVGNWSYDLFNARETNSNWSSYQFTTLQGGNVPAEEIESARGDLDEKTFRQEYEATFETYSGVIYYNFDRRLHIQGLEAKPNESQTLHIGMDFNIDPMVAVVGYETPNGVFHVFDHLRVYGSNTQEVIDEIRRRYPRNKIFVYPDASGKQRRTSASGMTDHILLQNAGFVLKVQHTNPAVKDRIAAVNSRLRNSNGSINLVISPNCKPVIESLERQTYREGTQIPDKDSGYDHMNDALGYVIYQRYPIKRAVTDNSNPGSWSHRIGA